MKQTNGIDYLLVDTIGTNRKAVSAGRAWLAENGGGCIVTPNKRTAMDALGVETERELAKAAAELGRGGVTLSWGRHGLPYGTKSVVALYMDKGVDDVIRHGDFERVFFVPWMEAEAEWFKAVYRPTVVEVGEDGALVPAAGQPETRGTEGLIPGERDETLRILALSAAGCDGDLQRPERERFKADLMRHRGAWVELDPVDVLRRCVDLGMTARTADEVSGMVARLREGHGFHPARGYEEGWAGQTAER